MIWVHDLGFTGAAGTHISQNTGYCKEPSNQKGKTQTTLSAAKRLLRPGGKDVQ